MAEKSVKLKHETEKLLNEARVHLLNLDPQQKLNDDKVIRAALKRMIKK